MMEGFFEWMAEASLLVWMILIIRRIFMGKIRHGVIYALWGLVLLRFLVPVNIFATPFSVENILSKRFSAWEAEELKLSERDNRGAKEGLWQEKGRGALLAEGSGRAVSGTEQEIHSASGKKGVNVVIPSDTKKSGEKAFYISWHQVLPVLWVTVSVSLFLWLFLSNVSLLGKMKRNSILYGKRGNVKIYAVCGIQNPCLYGFFRPSIYLPYSFVLEEGKERVGGEELEQMITHEFVHYRHGDHIWAMLRLLLVSVFWFNPFAWVAASYSKKDAELFCDETVICLLGEEQRFRYGEMLVRLAGKPAWGDFRYSMLPMSRKGKEMERRIRAISKKRKYSRWVIIPLAAALCMAVGITCSAGIDSQDSQTADTVKENNSRKKIENAAKETMPGAGYTSLWQENAAGSGHPYAFPAWLEKALQEPYSSSDTFSNALENNDRGEVESSIATAQKEMADTPEEAFAQYMEIFTAAVNSGNTDKMNQVLAQDSEVYAQQCNLVKNYYKRGIREKVKSYSVTVVTVGERMDGCVEIESKEKIRVSYADGESRIVKQQYRYTCEQYAGGGDGWIITAMEEI